MVGKELQFNFAVMHRELLKTADGSNTVSIPELDITYRSRHGALQESLIVFIEAGLEFRWSMAPGEPLRLFEMGFGTGLNALLTAHAAVRNRRSIVYTTMEPYPLETAITNSLDYDNGGDTLALLHQCDWNKSVEINEYFSFRKHQLKLAGFETSEQFDLVYFDAFGPVTQPEIWSPESFAKIFSMMNKGATLVTYCSKSVVRRTMKDVGFVVNKIPGPRGKREMVRATRP